MKGRRTKRELRAMAYALADEIETRADAIAARNPRLSYAMAQSLALADMIKGD